jgi:hypothetical protein
MEANKVETTFLYAAFNLKTHSCNQTKQKLCNHTVIISLTQGSMPDEVQQWLKKEIEGNKKELRESDLLLN